MARRVQGPDGKIHEFPDNATDAEISAALDAQPAHTTKTWTQTLADAIPAVGGFIGGLAGGPGGAAMGGAAGSGYQQLVEHAREIPGAVVDVARNLVNQPSATLRGAVSGATSGAVDAGENAAVQGGLELGGQLLAKGAQKAGTALYRGYVKPSLAANSIDKAREIVSTGIRENLPVTAGGEARAARIIGQLNSQVDRELAASNGTVDLTKIANRVRQFAKDTYYRPGSPTTDYDAAMKVADEIDRHPSLGLPAGAQPTRVDVPAIQANQVKQGLDRAIGDTGFGVERNAATEARKVGRNAARTAIENVVPGVGSLNARESQLIDAMEAIQKAAAREENKNLLTGWATNITAGGVGAGVAGVTHDPMTAVFSALAARGLISPAVATRAAILASKFGQSQAGPIVTSNAARLGLVLAVRELGKQPDQ